MVCLRILQQWEKIQAAQIFHQNTKTKQTKEHVAVGQGGRNSPTAS